jgi:hypothetical protein
MLLTPRLAYEREFHGSGLFQLGPASALFRTDQFRALGGFPLEGVASDYLFWLSACTKVNVLLVPGDLFYYRIHPGQEMSAPHVDVQYARAASVTWRMLHSDACPLDRAGRELAKRNFMYIVARESYRYIRRGRFASAVAVLRYAGVSPVDWIRYLRRPQRSRMAGTPSVDRNQVAAGA